MKKKEIFAVNNDKETFSFNAFNDNSEKSIGNALISCNKKLQTPIIICIGSDLVLGDSLGPLVGTMLTRRNVNAYIYGTLNSPITAKEINCAKLHVKMLHPESFIVAIDAAVGNSEDIGLIKVSDKGLKPGLGVNKNLGVIGDCSIIGVVAEKSTQNYNLFNLTRLNLIYKMAERIADGVEKFLVEYNQKNKIIA
ncbi:MAG: spore protease YyaC [Clostridia bacterium]|nr:spore protease YyaC [Clostridia bacterium]